MTHATDPTTGQAQATRPATIQDHLDVATPQGPQTNAAGRTVFVRGGVDAAADANHFSIWVAEASSADEASSGDEVAGPAAVRPLTQGPADTNPAWLGDSNNLVFCRPDANGVTQFFMLPESGDAIQLSAATPRLPYGVGAPVVSPDGARIAFVATVPRQVAPRQAALSQGHTANAPVVSGSLRHAADGMGLRGGLRQQLFLFDLETGEMRRLTDVDADVAAPTFSPDGETLAFTMNAGERAVELMERGAYAIRVADLTATARRVGGASFVTGPLQFTSDGSALLAVGRPAPRVAHNQLLLLSLSGEADRVLTAGFDRNIMPGGVGYPGGAPRFTAAGNILACVREGGSTEVWEFSLQGSGLHGSEPRRVLGGSAHVVSGFALGQNAAGAEMLRAVLATDESFGELVEMPLVGGDAATPTAPVTLTSFGDATAGVAFPAPEACSFTLKSGEEVHGFILRPLNGGTANGGKPGPVVLDVHGGPHNAWTGALSVMQPHHAELAARGYTVLMLNPRGSDGYGEDWFTGVYDGWGEKDLADLIEPLDQLAARGEIDPDRQVVTGYSYGGFMTCVLTSAAPIASRFQAAVAGGLVAGLGNFAGASSDGVLLDRFEFDPASGNAQRISPLNNVGAVTTPTLVLHGGSDLTCPVLQAEQWHAGLRLAGTPSELVIYPGGSHAFVLNGTPSHRVDYSERLVAWFERFLSARPARASVDPTALQARLDAACEKYGVPGASLGVLTTERSGPRFDVVTSGTLNTITGAPVTPDALFQIGSITKVWTGVLIMQLVDEGLLTLETPVREVLPGFSVADAGVSARVTVRELMTHTSGIDGDVFRDTGRGDDCVARYVDSLGDVVQNFQPGEDWSYCNTGFTVLGRIIEVLRGASWDEVLRERIIAPLGLSHTTTLPEDTMRLAHAIGHNGSAPGGTATPVAHPMIARSAGPAGLISARAEDLLRFAWDSIARTGDGTAPVLLSEATHRAMRDSQLPAGVTGATDVQGLTWLEHEWDGRLVHGHDGGTLGQQAFMRISEEAGVAIVLLANGGIMTAAANELIRDVFGPLAGISVPAPFGPEPGGAPLTDAEKDSLMGTYGDAAAQIFVERDDTGALVAHRTDRVNPSGREELVMEATMQLSRAHSGTYAAAPAGAPLFARVWRADHESGTVLHFGTRVFRKVN